MFGIQEYWNWRRAIFTQGVALFVIAIAFMFLPNSQIDILDDLKQNLNSTTSSKKIKEQIHEHFESEQISARRTKRQQEETVEFYSNQEEGLCTTFCILISNPVYLFTTLTISSIYFLLAGLQFWTISYLEKILNLDIIQS